MEVTNDLTIAELAQVLGTETYNIKNRFNKLIEFGERYKQNGRWHITPSGQEKFRKDLGIETIKAINKRHKVKHITSCLKCNTVLLYAGDNIKYCVQCDTWYHKSTEVYFSPNGRMQKVK